MSFLALLTLTLSYNLPTQDVDGNPIVGPLTSRVYCKKKLPPNPLWEALARKFNVHLDLDELDLIYTSPEALPGTRVYVEILDDQYIVLCHATAINISGKESDLSRPVRIL